jgi:copper chaperone
MDGMNIGDAAKAGKERSRFIKETAMMEFQVQDMSCGHCVAAITNAVKEVDASGKVEVDLAAKRVLVDSSHDAGEILAAIEEAGYTPVLAGKG